MLPRGLWSCAELTTRPGLTPRAFGPRKGRGFPGVEPGQQIPGIGAEGQCFSVMFLRRCLVERGTLEMSRAAFAVAPPGVIHGAAAGDAMFGQTRAQARLTYSLRWPVFDPAGRFTGMP